MSVTIVIPNHNEPQIDETLQGLLLLGCPVVVSNDPDGRGVGWAMREGLKEVRTDWVLFAMADGSEDLACLRRMIRRADNTFLPAVWGDRWRTGSVTGYPLLKRLANRLANHLIGLLAGRSYYSDWTDPAKAYRTAILRQVVWSDDFRSAVEMPVRYLRLCPAAAIHVVPMHWTERTQGVSAYRLRHALGCLRALGRVFLYG